MKASDISPELRRLIIKERALFKALVPTTHQAEVIQYAEREKVIDTSAVAKRFGVSIQSANGTLRRLWKVGHLNRENVGDPTGGTLYQYTPFHIK
ncbi:MAG: hypothetical protein CMF72_22395 [Mameliella sp.]|nr:hypothetical protein [Mameliella sp.]|tara:strand:- start:3882 stop:4166 length:285 start_codon:yes stop_codon:yes gene_type:complete